MKRAVKREHITIKATAPFYFLFPSPSNSHFQTGTTSISIPSQFKVASSLLVIRIHFESGMKLFNLTNARVFAFFGIDIVKNLHTDLDRKFF